jgi:hypothetical protein
MTAPPAERPRPLQNRVDPFGALHAVFDRGRLMGNRGGRIHDPDTRRLFRSHASRRWICCVLCFRNRQRSVWGRSYTELFFLDEATALAAGHRPCFECRREDALAFRDAFPGRPGSADAMDIALHAERRAPATRAIGRDEADALPDGAMVAAGGVPFLMREGVFLRWTFGGYDVAPDRIPANGLRLLTPPSTVEALRNGYSAVVTRAPAPIAVDGQARK